MNSSVQFAPEYLWLKVNSLLSQNRGEINIKDGSTMEIAEITAVKSRVSEQKPDN